MTFINTRRYVVTSVLAVLTFFLLLALSSHHGRAVMQHRMAQLHGTAQTGDRIVSNSDWGSSSVVHTKDFPITIIVKSGATEVYRQLRPHIDMTARLGPSVYFVSDKEMNIHGHYIADVIQDTPGEIMEGNRDFDLYKQLREAKNSENNYTYFNNDNNGWTLDKYKFLNIMLLARTKPATPWYVFIESDTLLMIRNLVQFLLQYDSNEPYYIGSVAMWKDIGFGHGGTGYILSRPALEMGFAEDRAKLHRRYNAKHEQYGDFLIALRLLDVGVPLTDAGPMFNGDSPSTIAFYPGQLCNPFITAHHVPSEEIEQMGSFAEFNPEVGPPFVQFQSRLTDRKTIIMRRHLYREIIYPRTILSRPMWLNQRSESPSKQYHDISSDACDEKCFNDDQCFQWSHETATQTCNLVYEYAMLGQPHEGYTSGWQAFRFRALAEQPCHNTFCKYK